MSEGLRRAHVFVSGHVQGVWFRESTRKQALIHQATGWVRNLDDGRVEGVFEGTAADVDALVAWCRDGPPASRVAGVEVQDEEHTGEFDDFSVTG